MGIRLLKQELNPIIYLPWDVKWSIDQIVKAHKDEVGWFGEARRLSEDEFIVDKIIVPGQDAHGTTTEIQNDDIVNIFTDYPEFDMDKWFYWGHSHGTMASVDPSDQDFNTLLEYGANSPFFLGTIHNHAGKMHGFCTIKEKNLLYEDVIVEEIEHEDVQNLVDEIERLKAEYYKKRSELIKTIDIDWKAVVKEKRRVKSYGKGRFGGGGKTWDQKKKQWVYPDKKKQ